MFQIGDLVRIKDRFWTCRAISDLRYNRTMQDMQGQEYTIKNNNVSGNKYRYRLDTDTVHDWVWDEAWLEQVTEIKDVYTEELDLLFMGD